MVTLKRPARLFSFADWNINQPKEPPPGDRLDAQFLELIDVISQTQNALAEIRRDDGTLNNELVGPEQLRTNFRDLLIGDIEQRFKVTVDLISATARAVSDSERSTQLFAQDAERALTVAQQLISDWNMIREAAQRTSSSVQIAAAAVTNEATDAENWADYAQAQAENAIEAKDEALQWAEYLAGPVVDAVSAPDYIANSPFPNGLFYQPVDGGVAGLWSAKWWALQARNYAGGLTGIYLGPFDHQPQPGEQNPDTGQVVPDPIQPGALYFDTTINQMMVWDGSEWSPLGGIPDAPYDGKLYGRIDATWGLIPSGPEGGLPEAPVDGKQYGRQDAAWTEIPSDSGIPEAPVDGQQYARKDAAWSVVTGGGAIADDAPIDDNTYARRNSAWVRTIWADNLNAAGETVNANITFTGYIYSNGGADFTESVYFYHTVNLEAAVYVEQTPTNPKHAVNKSYVDAQLVTLDGGTF